MHRGRKAGKRKTVVNRELSWLAFNRRVQQEADHPDNPLLERAKFLAIVTSNLDEFFQVRYRGILEAAQRKGGKRVLGGLTARGLYRRVNKEVLHQQNLQYMLFEGIRSELYLEGVQLYPTFTMTKAMSRRENQIFQEEIKPNLRLLLPGENLKQKQLHLLVKLHHPRKQQTRFATVVLPAALHRLFNLSAEVEEPRLIRLEDIVLHKLGSLFPKERVVDAAGFRVLRNQAFPMERTSQEDIPATVRSMLYRRRGGQVLRLEAEERMSEEMLDLLMHRFHLQPEQRYRVTGPLDLNKLMMNVYGLLQRKDLKYTPVEPRLEKELMGKDLFARIQKRDFLLYHPYHSFAPVVHFVSMAAQDPAVRSVKQTLYRVSANSPVVQALAQAAENGKQVTVLFEAYARFDEENNLFWGERLQRAGCRVIYGLPGLKTHSKVTLVEREEKNTLRRYLHLGTGNYHDGTAKVYTDFSLFTADKSMGEDVRNFFAGLEGEVPRSMEELIPAPQAMQTTLLHLIEREREHAMVGLPSGICAKMNSLSDGQVIGALCSASQAGVPIRLIVRGICCLLPQVPGKSENIQVVSIVGRNLEHARAFRFENGGDSQVYLSSADWMPRNLQRRVELMFPVKDPACKRAVENVLALQWADTLKAQRAQRDGSYRRRRAKDGPGLNAQEQLLYHLEEVFAEAPPWNNDNPGEVERLWV